jgi:Ca2+-binding RTX toxin-like protein
MSIAVKGTKNGSQTNEASSRQLYLLKELAPSKMPLAVGALLFGIAAYLKSALPSYGRLPPEEPTPAKDEPGLKIVDAKMMVESLSLEDLIDPNNNDESTDKDPANGSGTLFDHRNASAEYMLIDSPAISYEPSVSEPFQKVDVSALASFQSALTVANDNISALEIGSFGGSEPGDRPGMDKDPESPPIGDSGEDEDKDPESPPIGDGGEDEDPQSPVNRAPRTSGVLYLQDVFGCATALFALSVLLANASDPDGDVLSIQNLSVSSGTISQSATGWLYSPNGLGPVTISYQISDGKAFTTQYASFSVVKAPPVVGTNGDDMLVGTECADTIEGRDGNDAIDGRGGADTIVGGAGDDHIVGGSGDDILHGGEGSDVIFGHAGDDQISGGSGDDRLFGGEGNDIAFGDDGNDQILGGQGNDALFGGAGHDLISGDAGDDQIQGGHGHDILSGNDGSDVIAGDAGSDTIDGGAGADLLFDGIGQDVVLGGTGDDHVVVALDTESDTYDGGSEADTLDLSASEAAVEVDLDQGTANGNEIGRNTVANFEAVEGGSGDDKIAGAEESETLSGNAGNDQISGRGGGDELDGGAGCDILDGGAGNDTMQGSDGNDLLRDGAGQDVVSGGADDDIVEAANDGQDDLYEGGSGTDTLDYSASETDIVVDLTVGTAKGVNIGDDTISGFDKVTGGSGDDKFVVGSQAVVLKGGTGNDLFEFIAPSQASAPEPLLHEIVDFHAGDRIKMSKYDIFEQILDELEDQFEKVYAKEIDEDNAMIRYRHETVERSDRTVIEADIDLDSVYETTIYLHGHKAIVIVDQT